jgi:EAL domain-containing protein (putative c-di-GMP-specific phosphodiesterase class I)
VLESIALPTQLQHFEIHPSASIGIAMFPSNGSDLEMLSRNADLAMYAAKSTGRNKYSCFTDEMEIQSARHLTLLSDLRHALEKNQFSLFYQAQASVLEGRIVGAEALLRWHHPDLGPISPAEFIPICEESGLIVEIGEWVIRQAARHANTWIVKGLDPIVVSVNLSAAQFRQYDLPEVVSLILGEEGLSPDYLQFELTESLAMHDAKKAIETIELFAAKGLKLSIDDFGTGYSCLSYLKKFKVSKLKIDQSFVHDIGGMDEDRTIVKAIIQMAHSLGMATIAEGVETQEQLAFLSLHGCAEFQGYLINRPMRRPPGFE